MNEQQKPQDQQQKEDEPPTIEPGHVMAVAHYQRLAREAAEQQQK